METVQLKKVVLTFDSALGFAHRALAKHERFSFEISELLRKKDIDEETIVKVVDHLQSKNILNDRRCATMAIQRLTSGKPIGREKIKQKLLARGASEELIEELLPREEADLQQLLRKKFPNGAAVDKAARFLYSRGFEEDAIRSAVESFPKE